MKTDKEIQPNRKSWSLIQIEKVFDLGQILQEKRILVLGIPALQTKYRNVVSKHIMNNLVGQEVKGPEEDLPTMEQRFQLYSSVLEKLGISVEPPKDPLYLKGYQLCQKGYFRFSIILTEIPLLTLTLDQHWSKADLLRVQMFKTEQELRSLILNNNLYTSFLLEDIAEQSLPSDATIFAAQQYPQWFWGLVALSAIGSVVSVVALFLILRL